MTPELPCRYDLLWRRRELAALLALGGLAAVLLAARAIARAGWPGCSHEQHALRLQRAAEKIDPNTASVGSLMRLPGVGPAYARAIVAYRGAHGPRPFRTLQDLDPIKGIGPAAIHEMARYPQYVAIPEKP